MVLIEGDNLLRFKISQAFPLPHLVRDGVVDVVDLGVVEVGHGEDEGRHPEQRNDFGRPVQPGHGVRVQGVADGKVPGKQ